MQMCMSIALNYTIKFVVELLAYLVRSVDGGAHLQHLFQSGFIFLKVLYLLLKSVLSTTVEGRSCKRGKEGEGERGGGGGEGAWEYGQVNKKCSVSVSEHQSVAQQQTMPSLKATKITPPVLILPLFQGQLSRQLAVKWATIPFAHQLMASIHHPELLIPF